MPPPAMSWQRPSASVAIAISVPSPFTCTSFCQPAMPSVSLASRSFSILFAAMAATFEMPPHGVADG
jgi:hypothetical protein